MSAADELAAVQRKPRRASNQPKLPAPLVEPGFPDGDGPAWITDALGAHDDPIVDAWAIVADDGDEAALIVRLRSDRELLFRPAHRVTARRLVEVFGSRGCRTPYYGLADCARVGQALGRLAGRNALSEEHRSDLEFASIGAEWLGRCLSRRLVVPLLGRDGASVRAVIERVRGAAIAADVLLPPPLVLDVGADVLLVWTAPFRRFVRERRGTTSDDLMGVQMRRVGWQRDELAARPGPGGGGTVELAVWKVPNGWQGVHAAIPDDDGDRAPIGRARSAPFGTPTHVRALGRACAGPTTNGPERPNGDDRSEP
jgi:hypothetical protein